MTGLADHPRRPKRVDAQEQFRLGVATKLRRHRRSFEMGTRRDQNTIRRTIATCPSVIGNNKESFKATAIRDNIMRLLQLSEKSILGIGLTTSQ